ncbi:hypothetical protein LCGC14_2942510, partial [marine sediment metagenome]
TVGATVTLDGTAAIAFVDWTGTTLDDDVQKFVDGTYSNFGWLMYAPAVENLGAGADQSSNAFRASDYSTASERPKLVVIHAVAAAEGFPHSYGTIIGN